MRLLLSAALLALTAGSAHGIALATPFVAEEKLVAAPTVFRCDMLDVADVGATTFATRPARMEGLSVLGALVTAAGCCALYVLLTTPESRPDVPQG